VHPPRIQTGAARGTEISLQEDQLKVLDYWAQAGQTAMVGVSILVDNQQIGYWLETQIHPIAGEPLEMYLVHLRDQWLAELSVLSRKRAYSLLASVK
jgi:hypothetical protein